MRDRNSSVSFAMLVLLQTLDSLKSHNEAVQEGKGFRSMIASSQFSNLAI